jgi:peptidoglycan/xylan/chitin deacetylase (PgdA/CDA1 family)
MYHSVLPDPLLGADSLGGIIHSEVEFRAQMELLARDFNPVSLDEVLKHIRDRKELSKRSVVVTFDDGYADNYEVAMPVLNEVGVPSTFYATVDCVENRRLPWPSRLRFAFRKTKRKIWCDAQGKSWPLNASSQNEEAFLSACDHCCQLSGLAQELFLKHVEQDLESCLPGESGSLMMSLEDLRALARHGHVVGSHTMTHPNMAYLGEDDARRELTESKRLLEQHLGTSVQHFSYPCPALSPHWIPETVALSRAAGYESAVTTDSGLARYGDDAFRLSRIHPTKTVDGLRWNLESAFAGRKV